MGFPPGCRQNTLAFTRETREAIKASAPKSSLVRHAVTSRDRFAFQDGRGAGDGDAWESLQPAAAVSREPCRSFRKAS